MFQVGWENSPSHRYTFNQGDFGVHMWDEKTTYRIAGFSWGGPNIGPFFGSEADEITNNLWKQTQV